MSAGYRSVAPEGPCVISAGSVTGAVLPLPTIATVNAPPVVVSLPIANAPVPLAVASSPSAIETSPLAVGFSPIARERRPMLASSHWVPSTEPARNAAFSGCHMSRVPAPVMGMTPEHPA